MRNILIMILISIIFVGCNRVEPEYRSYKVVNNEKIFSINKAIAIKIPSSYSKVLWSGWSDFRTDRITLDRTIPNMMKQDINIRVENLEPQYLLNYKMLHKETNKELEKYFENQPLTNWEMTNHMERGVNYSKVYVEFIGGLKCVTNVESQNMAAGIGSKHYQSNCNYYNKQNQPKNIHIDYRFYYTFNRTKFEGSDNPSLVRYKLEEIQLQFKKDMKEIFDSLVIYDMDTERMQKEGLLYDEKYSLDNEAKVKDKSMECTFSKDSAKCVGRETGRKCTKKRIEEYNWQCEEKGVKNENY